MLNLAFAPLLPDSNAASQTRCCMFLQKQSMGGDARAPPPIRHQSALLLLVLGIVADDHDAALALDDLALFADRLYRRTNFHRYTLLFQDQFLLRQVIRPLVRS